MRRLAVLPLLFIAGCAQMQGDSAEIDLADFDFAPGTVDVTSTEKSVVCTIALTDTGPGIGEAGCVFMSPNSLHDTSCFTNQPFSGDIYNGVWTCTATIKQEVEDGTWKVSHVFARDLAFRQVSLPTAVLEAEPFPVDLEVTSTEDVTPPQLTAFDFTPVNAPPGTNVECDVTATDVGGSGVAYVGCTFGLDADPMEQISCLAEAPATTCNAPLPADATEGAWTVLSAFATDVVNNLTKLDTAALVALPATTEMNVGFGGAGGTGGAGGAGFPTRPQGPALDTCTENAAVSGTCVCEGSEYTDEGYCCTEGFSYSACSSSELYMKVAGTGTEDGSNWTNAMTFSESSLVRDTVHWIASGNYGTGVRTFGVATSGLDGITIRKATAAMHGTETGWSAGLGTGQATFGRFVFNTARYTIDGGEWNGIKSTVTGSPFDGNLVQVNTNAAYTVLRHIDMDGNSTQVGNVQQTGVCSSLQIAFADNVVVDRCEISAAGDDAVEIGGADNVKMFLNKIHGVLACGTEGTKGCSGPCDNGHGDGVELLSGNDFEFIGNMLYDVVGVVGLYFEGSGTANNAVIANNVIYVPETTGFASTIQNADGVRVYNNSFWGLWNGNRFGGIHIGANTTDLEMQNNIFMNINFNSFSGDPYDPAEHAINYNQLATVMASEFPDGQSEGVGNQIGDPDFLNIPIIGGPAAADLELEDFTLKATSPSIDQGSTAGPDWDIIGVARPLGLRDMGVFEVFDTSVPPGDIVGNGNVTGVWAQTGEDKVTQDEVRESTTDPTNSVFDRSQVNLFGMKNEVVSFNVVLEADTTPATGVSVTISPLEGPGPDIDYDDSRADVLDWTTTEIELFYVRYLPVDGISNRHYNDILVNEQAAPHSMLTGTCSGSPTTCDTDANCPGVETCSGATRVWADRPGANKFFPEIAVPMEEHATFTVPVGNQQVWADIYIPNGQTAGTYTGTMTISEPGAVNIVLPIELEVYDQTMSDTASSTAPFAYIEQAYVNWKHLGRSTWFQNDAASDAIVNEYFKLAHRHRIDLIGAEVSGDPATFIARTGQNARLTGTLFTSANGYAGPGDGVGLQTHAIGPQGGASWYSPWCTDSGEGCAGGPDSSVTQTATQYYADDWINAKTAQSWDADLFLYLIDEPLSANLGTYDQWAQWIDGAGSPGNQLQTFITKGAEYQTLMPNIDILAGVVDYTAHADWGDPGDNDLVTNIAPYIASGKAYGYNAKRPLAGSFAVADDGVSPRETMWAMHKLGIAKYWFWNVNSWQDPEAYGYYDLNSTRGDLPESLGVRDPFESSWTFGARTVDVCAGTCSVTTGTPCSIDMQCPSGETCDTSGTDGDPCTNGGASDVCAQGFCEHTKWGLFSSQSSNGDGLLMYPGEEADDDFPASNDYGIAGPIASLRMKHWRRGIQDLEYVAQADAIDSSATDAIVAAAVPLAWWEMNNLGYYGDQAASWSSDPDDWEGAVKGRQALLNIIEAGAGGAGGSGGSGGTGGTGGGSVCDSLVSGLNVTDGWNNVGPNASASGTLTFEGYAKVDAGDGIVAVGDQSMGTWGHASMLVRFDTDNYFDAYNGAGGSPGYDCDNCFVPWAPDVWYHVIITADVAAETYSVIIRDCSENEVLLISDAGFRNPPRGDMTWYSIWGAPSTTIDLASPVWGPGVCAPLTCFHYDCGTDNDDTCGGTIAGSCGTCTGDDVCLAGSCCTPETCVGEGYECGTPPDTCGGTLFSCGTCGGGETCSGAPGWTCIAGAAKPVATNTGSSETCVAAGCPVNSLSPYTGPSTITSNGASYSDFSATQSIRIDADNVTLSNFTLSTGAAYGIRIDNGHSGIVIEYGEITTASSAGLIGVGFTGSHLYIHDTDSDAMKVQGSGGPTIVEYSFIEKLGLDSIKPDGNQSAGSTDGVTFRYNNCWMPGPGPNSPGPPYSTNACAIHEGTIANYLYEYNWLNGGNFTMYCGVPGISVRNNRFGRDYIHGIRSGTCDEWTGNVWDDTGAPVPSQ